jgi:hypothetical protein
MSGIELIHGFQTPSIQKESYVLVKLVTPPK